MQFGNPRPEFKGELRTPDSRFGLINDSSIQICRCCLVCGTRARSTIEPCTYLSSRSIVLKAAFRLFLSSFFSLLYSPWQSWLLMVKVSFSQYVVRSLTWILRSVFPMTLMCAPRVSRPITCSGIELVYHWQVISQAFAGVIELPGWCLGIKQEVCCWKLLLVGEDKTRGRRVESEERLPWSTHIYGYA